MNERSRAREWSKQCRGSKWVSGVSQRANGRVSGPVLTTRFLAVLNHRDLEHVTLTEPVTLDADWMTMTKQGKTRHDFANIKQRKTSEESLKWRILEMINMPKSKTNERFLRRTTKQNRRPKWNVRGDNIGCPQKMYAKAYIGSKTFLPTKRRQSCKINALFLFAPLTSTRFQFFPSLHHLATVFNQTKVARLLFFCGTPSIRQLPFQKQGVSLGRFFFSICSILRRWSSTFET